MRASRKRSNDLERRPTPRQCRSGSILFTLAEDEDQARGDVLMTPLGSAHPYWRNPAFGPIGRRDEFPPPSESLTIRLVRVNGRYVSGAMDRYWDPDRSCWATTTFVGELVAHTIAGTFRTTFSAPENDVDGWWRVTRSRAR